MVILSIQTLLIWRHHIKFLITKDFSGKHIKTILNARNYSPFLFFPKSNVSFLEKLIIVKPLLL